MYVLKHKTPIARKQYKCMLCNEIIEIGEKYDRTTVVYEGKIYDFICHERCDELWDELNMSDEYEDDDIASQCFFDSILIYVSDNHFNVKSCEIDDGWDLPVKDLIPKILEELKNEDKNLDK